PRRREGVPMIKAVVLDVPASLLEERKRNGAAQWDERWEGVLHMAAVPNREHQDLEYCLEAYLRAHWAKSCKGRVYHQINLAPINGWPDDYRIPDLLLLTPDRFEIDHNEYFEGAPTLVVEIHSPGDESSEKLPFYQKLGVPEVWIIDRDTKEPEIHVLKRGRYRVQAPGRNGWV